MRYTITLLTLLLHGILLVQAQNHNLGVGYFGETLTYAGAVIEYEYEAIQSEKASLVSKANLGYYNHPRNHQAFFADCQLGLRRNLGSRFFIENTIGLGMMLPILNAPVYQLNDEGGITESSKVMNLDFMPSFSMGIGYDLDPSTERDALWIKPKIFWQYPYNTLPLPHIAIQVGFSHTFKTNAQ